jgi:eukaryotic translation initiation factor 2C
VTRPKERRADIERGVKDLRIGDDPYLRLYGVEIESQFTKTEARVLQPPVVNFGQGSADPKFAGRWDLRGKKFWRQNVAPLESWGFLVLDDCVNLPQLDSFARMFRQTFLGHGGKCPSDAKLMRPPGDVARNPADALAWAHKQLCDERGYPQLIFIVVRAKNSPHYERVKKSADCRFGVLSQVIQSSAVVNNNGQYHSNVAMKGRFHSHSPYGKFC